MKGPNMKTTFLIIAIIGCVALGILGVEQSKKLKSQSDELAATKQQVAGLEAELRQKEDAIEKAKSVEAKSRMLQQTLSESTTAAVAQSKKAEQLQQSLDESQTNNPMRAMAGMLKDPKMRDMLKAQQKAVLGPMIAKQYADFFKQMNMSPEQAATFKDLVSKKMLAGADAGLSMMDDSLDASQRADLTKQIKAQTDEVDAEIKQFLGDNNYTAYQTYEKTVQDRMSMSQFDDQLAGSDKALSPEQQSQMVQALSDARNDFNWTSGLNQPNPGANGDFASLLTEDNIAKFAAEREQFDAQFLAKAQQILTPEQLVDYKAYQDQQRELQLMGLKMAGQMYGSGRPGSKPRSQ
jgi:hypothetical protein